ncbi:uncharacterized protein [Linepithema humile]|uniref:uncharacterized protein isoform X2 n=1 Tax=Linepithema humile TaxID=83485 RepID=UPI00351F09C8
MERRRRLRLQLHEYEESSKSYDASHHSSVYEEEVLDLEESDADVNMQIQEQFTQEQIEDDSQSEDDISGDNNADWSIENTRNSMEDITDSKSDEFNEGVYLRMALTEWASHGVSKRKVNSLLSLLHKVHPELPKTYVSLLNTPKTTTVFEIDNGHMWHKGIKRNLDIFLTQEYLDTHGRIRLNINIDGLPLDKCGKLNFWPILGSLADKTCEPFIISVYFGIESKPSTLEQFLQEFINEMEELSLNGFQFNDHIYDVSIYNFICDAPARSFVKCIIGHNGLFSCEKCEIEGEWYHNRMVYLNNGQKRTDQSFIDRRNPEHHQGLSPLEERLNIGMYAVVAFTGEEEEKEGETIAVVPVKWIDKPDDEITDMFWPPKNWSEKGSRLVHIKKAVKNCIDPDIYWPLHKGSVLHLYREYDDAVRGLKKAEDDTSLETEADNAPRRRKLPRRYIDSDEDSEDKENNMSQKEKGPRKKKVRKLSESNDESDSKILPLVNSDVLNAVKESIYQVNQQDKEKVPEKQPLEKNIKVLQKFQDNYSQGSERKQRQLQKVRGSQSQSNIIKTYEKQRKMDAKQKKFVSVTMPSKKHVTTFFNSEASTVFSPMKDKVTSSKISEISNTPPLNSPTSDFISGDDAPQDTQLLFPSLRINSSDKGSSCSSQNPSCSLVQTITSGASFEGRSSSTSEADQNESRSTFYKLDEKKTKLQEKFRYFYNFKDKDMFLIF